MSATEHKLLEQLAAAAPERKALERIVAVSRGALSRLSARELRYYEIALEGLGVSTARRQSLVRESIQARRDRIEAERAAKQEARNEAS